MTTPLLTIELLLLVAAVVAMAARRLRIPYTVGLVLAGLVLALLRLDLEIPLTRDLVYSVFLPPLVFEAALYIEWAELRRNLPVVVTFATVGVVIAAAVTAAGMHFIVGWGWANAVQLGTLIAATDPVSVIATFKEAAVQGRLRLLVESESLFNDSTAAIAFGLALTVISGMGLAAQDSLVTRVVAVGGGVATGLIVAGLLPPIAVAIVVVLVGRAPPLRPTAHSSTSRSAGTFRRSPRPIAATACSPSGRPPTSRPTTA